MSPVSSPYKRFPKHLEELNKSHPSGELQHKHPGPRKLSAEATLLPHLQLLTKSQAAPGLLVHIGGEESPAGDHPGAVHHWGDHTGLHPAPSQQLSATQCSSACTSLYLPWSKMPLPGPPLSSQHSLPPEHCAPAPGSPHSEGGKRSPSPARQQP